MFHLGPYTNYHDLNLDWVLSEMRKAVESYKQSETYWTAAKEEFEKLTETVNTMTVTWEEFKNSVQEDQGAFKEEITNQQNEFQSSITDRQTAFEGEITDRQNSYEFNLTIKNDAFQDQITSQQTSYETDLTGKFENLVRTEAEARETLEADVHKYVEDWFTNVDAPVYVKEQAQAYLQSPEGQEMLNAVLTDYLSAVHVAFLVPGWNVSRPITFESSGIYNLLSIEVASSYSQLRYKHYLWIESAVYEYRTQKPNTIMAFYTSFMASNHSLALFISSMLDTDFADICLALLVTRSGPLSIPAPNTDYIKLLREDLSASPVSRTPIPYAFVSARFDHNVLVLNLQVSQHDTADGKLYLCIAMSDPWFQDELDNYRADVAIDNVVKSFYEKGKFKFIDKYYYGVLLSESDIQTGYVTVKLYDMLQPNTDLIQKIKNLSISTSSLVARQNALYIMCKGIPNTIPKRFTNFDHLAAQHGYTGIYYLGEPKDYVMGECVCLTMPNAYVLHPTYADILTSCLCRNFTLQEGDPSTNIVNLVMNAIWGYKNRMVIPIVNPEYFGSDEVELLSSPRAYLLKIYRDFHTGTPAEWPLTGIGFTQPAPMPALPEIDYNCVACTRTDAGTQKMLFGGQQFVKLGVRSGANRVNALYVKPAGTYLYRQDYTYMLSV